MERKEQVKFESIPKIDFDVKEVKLIEDVSQEGRIAKIILDTDRGEVMHIPYVYDKVQRDNGVMTFVRLEKRLATCDEIPPIILEINKLIREKGTCLVNMSCILRTEGNKRTMFIRQDELKNIKIGGEGLGIDLVELDKI